MSGQKKGLGNKWERNYARYLDLLLAKGDIAEWEREPVTFWFCRIGKELKGVHIEPSEAVLKRHKGGIIRGIRSYKPDFKIVNRNGSVCYHEVKGFLDRDSKVKLKRMKLYHPEETVHVITKEVMKELKKKLSGVIPEWEC